MRRFKLASVFIALLTLIVPLGLVGCDTSIAGKYVDQANPHNYIELNKDGTCFNTYMGIGQEGTWEVREDELRVKLGGFVLTADIDGDRLITPQGQVLVKK